MAKLSVKVVPKASRSAALGWQAEALRVAVAAPPERGKANAALEELIAGLLGLPRDCVRVASGQTARRKVLEIDGLADDEIARRLNASMAPRKA